MSNENKLLIGVGLATLAIIVGAVFLLSGGQSSSPTPQTPINQQLLVRNGENHTLGSEQSTVKIVEFADFECPGCAQASPVLTQLVNQYPGQVQLIYRHFPLPQHTGAGLAAEAAEAAGSQGKFWEMHDLLFTHQTEFTTNDIMQLAGQIKGLNLDQFKQDLQQHKFKNLVDQDFSTARQLNLNATPTLFINGVKYNQNPTLDNLTSTVNQLLENPPSTSATDSTSPSLPSENQEATPSAN